MHKILNYFFGWDYIVYENSATKGIARIRLTSQGEPYFLWTGFYSSYTHLTKENKESTRVVSWLTCESEKYIK